MKSKQKLLLKTVVIIVGLLLALSTIQHFPWKGTQQALFKADLVILSLAAAVNLISLVAKGTAWHILLRSLTYSRWGSVQTANLIGAMVNSFSITVAGDAARVHSIVRKDGVPVQTAIVSLVWSRTLEGITIILLIILGPVFFTVPSYLRGLQAGAAVILIIFLLIIFLRKSWKPSPRLPQALRTALSLLSEIRSYKRVVWPLLFAIITWTAQWAIFHLSLLGLGAQPSLAASLTALLATYLSGILRLTPANVGIFQASMVASLLTFGIAAEKAMAASLALQAIQVIPVVIIGLILSVWLGPRKSKKEI
jgi:uncharacterized protein (TIRG00374 family)